MTEFSLWKAEKFSVEDLECYLSANSVFHRSFDPSLVPFGLIHRCDDVLIAEETFIYTFSLEEWIERMTSLGCRRLPDRFVELSFSEDLDELRAKIDDLAKNGKSGSVSV
jgi:hypothetical protein